MLLLAVNGILEAFVHAVAEGRALVQGHAALIIISISQTLVTIPLILYSGTLGMIAADSLGMLMRIAFCLWFIVEYQSTTLHTSSKAVKVGRPGADLHSSQFRAAQGSSKVLSGQCQPASEVDAISTPTQKLQAQQQNKVQFWGACPSQPTCLTFAFCFSVSAVSCALLFGRGPFSLFLRQRPCGFTLAIAIHVMLQVVLLLLGLTSVWKFEKDLWVMLKTFKRKQI